MKRLVRGRPKWPAQETINGVVYRSDRAEHVAHGRGINTELWVTMDGHFFLTGDEQFIVPLSIAQAVEAVLAYHVSSKFWHLFENYLPLLRQHHLEKRRADLTSKHWEERLLVEAHLIAPLAAEFQRIAADNYLTEVEQLELFVAEAVAARARRKEPTKRKTAGRRKKNSSQGVLAQLQLATGLVGLVSKLHREPNASTLGEARRSAMRLTQTLNAPEMVKLAAIGGAR